MKDRTVLVTGGFGFIGSRLVQTLIEAGARVRVVSHHPREMSGMDVVEGDLTDPRVCTRAVKGVQDVFHLAAFGWGLGENQKFPAQLLTQNALMSLNLLEAARQAGVERYLYSSSSSVYPAHAQILEEEMPWDGPPHPSELTFGWAKRIAEVQARAYHDHYGMKIAIVRPSNPYGPGDDFDPARAHVIPSLIVRIASGASPLVVWGTGRGVRSFINVDDVVRGMMHAIDRGADADPVNLASPETTTIKDLVELLVDVGGAKGLRVEFDASQPEGHPKKIPSVEKARRKLGFTALTPLRQGLEKTVRWYREHLCR